MARAAVRNLIDEGLRLNEFMPWEPEPAQAAFLLLDCREAFYGGAGGGGKSVALLMAALQYVDLPQYRALILRRTQPELRQPKALIDLAQTWLGGTRAKWLARDLTWVFPSGAKVGFGYLQDEADKFRYDSAAFHFVAFDELTKFHETAYTFMFSRLRKDADDPIPLRMRSASNPGGRGHEWVHRRLILAADGINRVFVPAKLGDNPHLDGADYELSLAQLDPITKRQILDGDWTARHGGTMCKREWLKPVPGLPADDKGAGLVKRAIRYWDLAATEARSGADPDWTAGVLMAAHGGLFYIVDAVRRRGTPGDIETLIANTAAVDRARFGPGYEVCWEEEGGSGGKFASTTLARRLAGFRFRTDRKGPGASKHARFGPFCSQAQAGNVRLVIPQTGGAWMDDYLAELEAFPEGSHDDQVDGTSGAFHALAGGSRPTLTFA